MAGLFAGSWPGAFQVTLRRPAPLDAELAIHDETADGTPASATDDSRPDGSEAEPVGAGPARRVLRHGDEDLVVAVPAVLDLDLPAPVSVEVARAAEAGSPAVANGGTGVHPTCFGCGMARAEGDGLRIAVGPVDGAEHAAAAGVVAGTWRPRTVMATEAGRPDPHPGYAATPEGAAPPALVVAALDCPGAFAFLSDGQGAGLLGRITFEQFGAVDPDADHVVVGWQIGTDGPKMLAGTVLFDGAGEALAAASAVWFPFRR